MFLVTFNFLICLKTWSSQERFSPLVIMMSRLCNGKIEGFQVEVEKQEIKWDIELRSIFQYEEVRSLIKFPAELQNN